MDHTNIKESLKQFLCFTKYIYVDKEDEKKQTKIDKHRNKIKKFIKQEM